jgi:RNA recognition motif-containing protein
VVRKKTDAKSRGYGFVAFGDPEDFLKAWKEMDGESLAAERCSCGGALFALSDAGESLILCQAAQARCRALRRAITASLTRCAPGKYIGSRPCRLKKASEDVGPVEIGHRKDRLLANNVKHDDWQHRRKMGGALGSTLRQNGGFGRAYGKK